MGNPSGGPETTNKENLNRLSVWKSQPTAGCLFSGMGGFASGLLQAGFSIRWASDNDTYACAAFRHRFPDIPLVEKDVRELYVRKEGLSAVQYWRQAFHARVSPKREAGAVSKTLVVRYFLRFRVL